MRFTTILALCLVLAACATQTPDSLVSACDRAGDNERGVSACTKAVSSGALTPLQEAQVLSDRGHYYMGLRQFDDAIADYDRSIALNPDLADAYFWRGLSYFYRGKYDEALENYDQALKIDPKMVEAYNSRGHTHFTRREWDLAVPEYKRAIEVDPDFAPAHQNLATTYVELGQYELAIEEYDRTLELQPWNHIVHAQRAIAHAWAGDVDGALQDADEFLAHADDPITWLSGLNPVHFKFTSHLVRGTFHLKKEDYGAAIASFDDAINIKSRDGQGYYLRAAAYRLAGENNKADEDAKLALEFDPEIETKMKPWLQGIS